MVVNPEILSALLDSEATADEIDIALRACEASGDARETVSIHQMVKDAVGGTVGLDHGYSLRILRTMEARGILPPRATL
jgi:negative regulator of sigma E activity